MEERRKMNNLYQINLIIRNSDNIVLRNLYSVKEYSNKSKVSDSHIRISVLDDNESTLNDINNFLSGDLSTLTWEFDLTDEVGNIVNHVVKVFEGYTLEPIIYRSINVERNVYSILIRKVTDEYIKAKSDKDSIDDLYNAIAEVYETREENNG